MKQPKQKKIEALSVSTKSCTVLSVQRFAEATNLSERTVRQLIALRKIAHVRFGRRVGITTDSLEKFIQESTVAAFDAKTIAKEIIN